MNQKLKSNPIAKNLLQTNQNQSQILPNKKKLSRNQLKQTLKQQWQKI